MDFVNGGAGRGVEHKNNKCIGPRPLGGGCTGSASVTVQTQMTIILHLGLYITCHVFQSLFTIKTIYVTGQRENRLSMKWTTFLLTNNK